MSPNRTVFDPKSSGFFYLVCGHTAGSQLGQDYGPMSNQFVQLHFLDTAYEFSGAKSSLASSTPDVYAKGL
jgi:hypothetical protein